MTQSQFQLIMYVLVVLAALFWVVMVYNGLVVLKNRVKNAWSQIDVQLKRRCDLIPNLIETVKGYAAHESATLENVVKARQQAINVGDNVKNRAEENYPDLKANQNFMQLQEELTSTENKISFARQFYNDAVMAYNNKKEMFPSSIIAGIFNFEHRDFFEIAEAEKAVPKVSF